MAAPYGTVRLRDKGGPRCNDGVWSGSPDCSEVLGACPTAPPAAESCSDPFAGEMAADTVLEVTVEGVGTTSVTLSLPPDAFCGGFG